MHNNEKTTRDYWQETYSTPPKFRLPSGLISDTRNLQRLLKANIKPGMNVLEIGCAPGKHLVWVAKVLKAKASGLDYSEHGIAFTHQLFSALNVEGDLRCENIFSTTFSPGSFDFVYSVGVIEHFDDPKPIVRRHVELLKPNGTALIIIPDYQGLYGRLQRYFDPENLLIHNLDIMTCEALVELAPVDLVNDVYAFHTGRIVSGLINFQKKVPPLIARAIFYIINAIGVIQPFDISPLCPWLALRLVRAG